MCSECGAHGCNMKCARCRFASYCSVECQRKNWPIHKVVCTDVTPERRESIGILRRAAKISNLAALACGLHTKFGLAIFVEPVPEENGYRVELGTTKVEACSLVHKCSDGTTPVLVLQTADTWIADVPDDTPEKLFFIVTEEGITVCDL